VHHETALLATLAIGLSFALIGGYLAVRLRQPPVLGYLLAGIAVGPFTPGVVADPHLAPQLAEVGVILLLFGVGMHFSLRDLAAVRSVALPGALAQIVVTTALGLGLATLWGWPLAAGLVFGLALSVASTVVLLRALEARGRFDAPDARIAVGWLVVEDLVMVLALVAIAALAPPVAGAAAASRPLAVTLAITLGKVAAFVALMLLVGVRVLPWLLTRVERTGSRELFTLATVALALGVAFGAAQLFGVSFALGAFIGGVMIHESDLSQRAARDLRPLQDAFAALFFVAVGMLFDPSILVRQPLQVLGVLGVVILGKSAAAFALVRLLGHGRATALEVSAALAQIGEFSFILAGMAVRLGVLPGAGYQLILAGALLSITLNPLAFRVAAKLAKPRRARA
jgi:CPA2 family monovalent cation:H+ antiporter-2